MADRAKLFKTGGSQAVRLPRAYRFEGQTEVLIRREGKRVVLALAGSAADFPYPTEPPAVEAGPELE
jgi:virulence-associated protein VagC